MNKKLTSLLLLIWLLAFSSLTINSLAGGEPRLGDPPAAPERVPVAVAIEAEPQAGKAAAFLPFVNTPPAWVNTAARAESQRVFRSDYLGTENVDTGWRGNLDACNAGTTSEQYRAAVLRRINYFRGMAGVPEISGLDSGYNTKAQAAALMMSVNIDLDHVPPSTWKCYTAAGSEGAGSSNLALGYSGTNALSHGYMRDNGGNNFAVGHRRWILYPKTRKMGTGDIPASGRYPPTNALWVFDIDHFTDPRPTTRDDFVAWPPPGYVPYQVVYPRWSISYPGADFSRATVAMTRAGQGVAVKLLPVYDGFGENTLVWEPQANFANPAADTRYAVTVGNVLLDGRARSFSYTVIVFDPAK